MGETTKARGSKEALPYMKSIKLVLHGILKLRWNDGFEGLVDLRPIIARGNNFVWLQEPEHFAQGELAEYGHSIGWINDKGQHIDFGADMLHALAIKQRDLLLLAG